MTDINLNSAECITTQANIGSTVYHNICTGATQTVNWGSADWLAAAGLAAVVIFIIGMFAYIGAMLFRDTIYRY